MILWYQYTLNTFFLHLQELAIVLQNQFLQLLMPQVSFQSLKEASQLPPTCEHRLLQFTFITQFFSGLYVINRIAKKFCLPSPLQLMKYHIARTHSSLQKSVRIEMGSSHMSKKKLAVPR